MHDAIVVEGVSKQFPRYSAHKPVTLHAALVQGLRGMRKLETVSVLQDVSFRITPGRMVGLIGRNGSGKSTLLRLIGGIGLPDQGQVKVNGRLRALLDLGVGLQPDLTGRENVFISGVIAGLTRRQVQQRFDEIVSFAELETYIDNPLRAYSTGMRMRLGFSIAVHTSPEILLLDEVLAVGDLTFQRKCLNRIAQFKSEGCTIIFVSHDEAQIKRLCDEVIYLREGKLVAHGDTEILVNQYISDASRPAQNAQSLSKTSDSQTSVTGIELKLNENRFGSLEMQITSVRLLNGTGQPIQDFKSGERLTIEIEYNSPQQIQSPIFSVTISREKDELKCYDTNTSDGGQSLATVCGPGRIVLHIERLDLAGGQYYVNVGIYEMDWKYAYDYHWKVYSLPVVEGCFTEGVLSPPQRWDLSSGRLFPLSQDVDLPACPR